MPDVSRPRIAGDAALLRHIIAASGMGIAHVQRGSNDIELEEAAQALLCAGTPLDISQAIRRVDRRDRSWAIHALRTAAGGNDRISEATIRFRGDDGKWRWVRVHASRLDSHCPDTCWVLALFDVTEEKAAFEQLSARAEHLHHTVEMNPQIPWCGQADGKLIEVTDRWLKITGLTRDQALGFDAWNLTTHPDDIEMASAAIMSSMMSGAPLDIRVRVKVVQGGYRWFRATAYPRFDDNGQIVRWYGYTEDIHEHVLVEQKIRWTAEHDTLTGLPNRMLFNRRLEGVIDAALQKLSRVGLLILDVDQFKEINDLMGHDAGDALLRNFAQKLLLSLPETATIARIGGDEFAVLLPDVTSIDEITGHCERIFETLKEPLRFAGRNVDCRTSIGAAVYPDHGQRSSELMKHADLALYSVKTSGRGRMMVFEPSMHDEMRHRVSMLNRARSIIEENAIIPYYQPKVSLQTGKIVGFEALLRWKDGQGRIFTPATISAAFEELDLAEAMGEAVFDRVLQDMMQWRGLGLNFGHVAINAAPAELRRNILAERIIERLKSTGIPPRELQLEVTEGVFLGRGAEHAERAIRELHEYGINIALDDFGTGFASLSHLRQFPVDTLKIDRSFVSDVAYLSGDAAIVSAIVNLGRNLGMKVVAEGVETPAQAAVLHAQGCEYGQGYLFCKPLPPEEVPDVLRNWQPIRHWEDSRPKPNRSDDRKVAAA